MSGLGTGIPVYSRLSISIRISQSELNGDRGLTDPQHSTLTRWQVARRLGSNCVTTVTLLHFNDLFDHHLPGPCGSARSSTLGHGTGLRLTEKGVVWLVRGNYTNKVWFPGQGALTHSAHTVAPHSQSVKLRPVRLTTFDSRTGDSHVQGGEVPVRSPDRNEVTGRLAVWSNSVRTVG